MQNDDTHCHVITEQGWNQRRQSWSLGVATPGFWAGVLGSVGVVNGSSNIIISYHVYRKYVEFAQKLL